MLESIDTHFVVVDRLGSGRPPYRYPSMTARLVCLNGSGARVPTSVRESGDWLPALSRHRLVFEAADRRDGVCLYEIVHGARGIGNVPPGSTGSAEVQLESASARALPWATRQRVDANVNLGLRVPYFTKRESLHSGSGSSGVHPVGAYSLQTEHGAVLFHVPEQAVRDGLDVGVSGLARQQDSASGDCRLSESVYLP